MRSPHRTARWVLGCLVVAALAGCGSGGSDMTGPPETPVPTSVRLTSDAGDFIGDGKAYSYSQANAVITVTAGGGHLSVGIKGDEGWTGEFDSPSGPTELQAGTHGDLTRYPFNDPAKGGMSWSGEGRGCNTLVGSFTIDKVTYTAGTLTALDMHFDQHCESAVPALRGTVHWITGDPTVPAGPVTPVPSGLWRPAAGTTPATGNYVYFESTPGDFVGGGQTYTYTQANAVLTVNAFQTRVQVSVAGDEVWDGQFETMNTITQVQPGYYPNLHRYPFHNPTRGGEDWSGRHSGCNTLDGWLVIDAITFVGGALTALDLRFEQFCDGVSTPLHGAVHWRSDDPTQPAGPITPPPAGLWRPAPGSTPPTGSYVYLESEAGDYVGQGLTHTYTPADATIALTTETNHPEHLFVTVNGAQFWIGSFVTMSSLTRFQPGYYSDLLRDIEHNPVKGGLDWGGDGRGCNTLTGWFVVDSVSYLNNITLTAIDLRFEVHCEGATPALHGVIHWTR